MDSAFGKKHILFLNPYYLPEITADTHLEQDLIQALIKRNTIITIICPIPSRGVSKKIRREYSKRKKEKISNNLTIIRFWSPIERKNPILRAFRYFYTNIRTISLAKKIEDVDVVYCISTPPTQGVVAAKVTKYLKKKKSVVRFIYNVQDLFPQSLVNTRLSKEKSLFWKIGLAISKYSYKSADRIITLSDHFKDNICEIGVPKSKISVISNWIDLKMVKPVDRANNPLIEKFNLNRDSFIVVYAGNFGVSQGVEMLYDVCERLIEYRDISFVFFGSGALFDQMKNKLQDLDNVSIHGLQPVEDVSFVYSLGDLNLIMCKKGTGKTGMPSKLWSMMACNRYIIASFDKDSDLAREIINSQAGIVVDPGDPVELSSAILDRYQNWKKSRTTEQDFRKYVQQNADKDSCVNKYLSIILDDYII